MMSSHFSEQFKENSKSTMMEWTDNQGITTHPSGSQYYVTLTYDFSHLCSIKIRVAVKPLLFFFYLFAFWCTEKTLCGGTFILLRLTNLSSCDIVDKMLKLESFDKTPLKLITLHTVELVH